VPSGLQLDSSALLPPAAASPAPQLHSFAPPPLLPNSKRKKSFSEPSFFAASVSSGSASLGGDE
jgi:hypothetical protein